MADSLSPDDVFDQASSDAELDWGAALAEQAQAMPVPTAPVSSTPKAATPVFPNLQAPSQLALSPADLERVLDVPVRLTAELGRTRITIKTLLQLAPGSVLELDGLAGEPMDLFVNGYLIAQGEVVVVGEKYGIRVTDIVTPSERMQKLNR
jgi:flagellar motor switch protein FliN